MTAFLVLPLSARPHGRRPISITTVRGLQAVVFAAACLSTGIFMGRQTGALADPPAAVQADERKAQLAERERLWAEVQKFDAAGQRDKAIELLQKKLLVERALQGDEWVGLAASYKYLAVLHFEGDDFQAGHRALENVVAINAKAFGADNWQTADARRQVAAVDRRAKMTVEQRQRLEEAKKLSARSLALRQQGDFVNAAQLGEKAAEIRKAILGERDSEYAASLGNLGWTLLEKGEFARAEPLFQQVIEINKAAVGEQHPEYATSLSSLALLYELMADYARSEQLYRQALDIRRTVLGEKHLKYADTLSSLGALYSATGDYARAEPLVLKAIEIKKATVGENNPSYSNSLNNLAVIYRALADYTRAEPLYRQASEIDKATLGEKHPNYATSLNNLAVLYDTMGDFARAEPLYRQSLEIRKTVLGEKHPEYAASLNNLATLYDLMGDYQRSEPMYRQALEIDKAALGEKHPGYAIDLNNLATHYLQRGDYTQAEPLYQQALEIEKLVPGEKHPDYATDLNNLAVLYHATGDFAREEELCRQALEIRKEALGEKHPSYAISLNNLGELYRVTGDYARAEPLLQQALTIQKPPQGQSHPSCATSLNNLAMLYRAMHKPDEAEPLVREALTIEQLLVRQTALVQSERQQRSMAMRIKGVLDNYLSLVASTNRSIDAVYQGVLATKGAMLVRQRQARLARSTSDPKLLATLTELKSLATRQQKLAYAVAGAADRDALKKQIDGMQRDREELEARLSIQSEVFRQSLAEQRMEPAELKKALPVGSALVDMIIFWRSTFPGDQPGKTVWEKRLAAFVVLPEGPIAFEDLGSFDDFGRNVDLWLEQDSEENGKGKHRPGMGRTAEPAGRELRRLFWDKIEPHLAGAKLVLVSPDGPLCRFPLSALPGANADEYLIEDGYQFVVLPAPQLLPELAALPQPAQRARGKLLVLGDVDYGPGLPLRPLLSDSAARLTHTRAEINDIEVTYRDLADSAGQTAAIAVCKLRDFVANNKLPPTKANFCDQAPACRYLHLATHGFFARADSKSAGRDVRDSRFSLSGQGLDDLSGWAPELLSGLMLSGANRPADENGEDGILTALELAELDLHQTDLAVLSACQTGLGEVAGGEGVLGLQRALHVAGVRTAMTSLWTIDDQATQKLMSDFYHHLWGAKPLSSLEALHQAQLDMLHNKAGVRGLDTEPPPSRLPPYYWAAFVLSGDWR